MAAGQPGRPRARRSRRRAAVALGVATAVVPIAPVGTSAGGPVAAPPSEPSATSAVAVELLDSGAGERVALPPPAVVGQSVSIETAILREVSLSGGGADTAVTSGFEFVVTATVIDAADGVGYTVRTRIDSIEADAADNAGIAADEGTSPLLVGVEYDRQFGAAGELVTTEVVATDALSPIVAEAADRFVGDLNAAVLAFPSEPIGVGARWSVAHEVVSGAITIPVVYAFELVEVADDRFGLDVTFHSEFGDPSFADPSVGTSTAGEEGAPGDPAGEDSAPDVRVAVPAVAGSITGSGSIVGSLTNPLDVTLTLDQVVTATLDTGDGRVAFAATISVEQIAS